MHFMRACMHAFVRACVDVGEYVVDRNNINKSQVPSQIQSCYLFQVPSNITKICKVLSFSQLSK